MKPKYKQETLLPKLEKDLAYPQGFIELSRLKDTLNDGDYLFLFRYDDFIIFCEICEETLQGDQRFSVSQFEAPLELLRWFPRALEEFVKPSSQGGLHPGAMTSRDEDVGGEMLCVQRAMDIGNNQGGYYIVNRSREDRFIKSLNDYGPMEICFPENFLYEGGLLNLIKTLGEKYDRGEL